MLNRIVLIGRLTRDTELRSTANGTSVCKFTLAVDRNFQSASGKKEADFIPVIAWKGLGETCDKYLSKGKIAAVDGRLQIRTYEAKDGSKRTASEVVAENVRFLSPKSDSVDSGNSLAIGEEEIPIDDDIPF